MEPSAGAAPRESLLPHLHAVFLSFLPRIELHGRVYFRHQNPDKREELVAEMVALAWKWFLRLVRRGKNPADFPSALATFAARAVQSGRGLCGCEPSQDVLSPVARRRHDFSVEPLPSSLLANHEIIYGQPHGQELQDEFEERLRDNTVTPPDQQAAFRIDFPAWLGTRTERDRGIIRAMAQNERTQELSRAFGVSPGRISQLRREFHEDWERFTAEQPANRHPTTEDPP
jgi:hypothetical protein